MTTKQEYRERLKEFEDAEKRIVRAAKDVKKLNQTAHYELMKAAQSVALSKAMWIRSQGFSFGRTLE